MKFSDLKSTILEQFKTTHEVVPFSGGKSSCAREIAQELAVTHKIPSERIIEFNPSLREPCDVLGLPQFHGECTKWLPPEEFWALRQGVGPCVLILEELSDADMNMQNPLCRVVLDRCAGQLRLSDQLFIIATGNRRSIGRQSTEHETCQPHARARIHRKPRRLARVGSGQQRACETAGLSALSS